MRYYDISIDGGPHFSSLATNGQNDPNAHRVKFTIENDNLNLTPNTSFVSIYGIDIGTMMKANTYNGKRIVLNAGFSPGLPLATLQSQPPRRGLLIDGIIEAASGNWRGSEISLDILLQPTGAPKADSGRTAPSDAAPSNGSAAPNPGGDTAAPQSQSRLMRRALPSAFAPRPSVAPRDGNGGGGGFGGFGDISSFFSTIAQGSGGGFLTTPTNLIHNLMPGQWLGDAITQTLTTAFPGTSVLPLISQNLKTSYQDSGFYQNLQQLTGYYKQLGQTLGAMGGGTGSTKGIDTYIYNNQFIVTDWTQAWADELLDYTDLIGQPTWVAFDEIFFSSVMRADLIPVTTVSFPPVLSSVTLLGTPYEDGVARNLSDFRQLIFDGQLLLYKVRHVGDSRSPDGAMWRTDCWGTVASGGGSGVAPSQTLTRGLLSPASGFGSGNLPTQQSVTPQRLRSSRSLTARPVRQWV